MIYVYMLALFIAGIVIGGASTFIYRKKVESQVQRTKDQAADMINKVKGA